MVSLLSNHLYSKQDKENYSFTVQCIFLFTKVQMNVSTSTHECTDMYSNTETNKHTNTQTRTLRSAFVWKISGRFLTKKRLFLPHAGVDRWPFQTPQRVSSPTTWSSAAELMVGLGDQTHSDWLQRPDCIRSPGPFGKHKVKPVHNMQGSVYLTIQEF